MGADLEGANFMRADLVGANLAEADLTDALFLKKEQLCSCYSLKGATMPNGQKYEDWLEAKSCGKDGENSGPS